MSSMFSTVFNFLQEEQVKKYKNTNQVEVRAQTHS